MSGFDESWLSLRAAADEQARGASDALLAAHSELGAEAAVLDIGAGSGNNAAYLAPRLAALGCVRQRWTLVDDDAALLARATARVAGLGDPRLGVPGLEITVATLVCDLAAGFDGRRLAASLTAADLVTASALLDLASRPWLDALAGAIAGAEVPLVLAALSIDGRVHWTPTDPFDARVTAAFDADMQRDKGLGTALAGMAPSVFATALSERGYRVETAETPWLLGARDAALQARYVEDAATVAARTLPAAEVHAWRVRRRSAIAAGVSELIVGHVDVLGSLSS